MNEQHIINLAMGSPYPLTNQHKIAVQDQIRVLLRKQDSVYRRKPVLNYECILKQKLDSMLFTSSAILSPPLEDACQMFEVDASCRLKMSEWGFKIVDYFGACREIVAIAFDYLDRLLEKYSW